MDALIAEIREKWHRPALEGRSAHHGDVAIVAHGHILRAFAQRWTGSPLNAKPAFLMEAGGVGTLRYVQSFSFLASPWFPNGRRGRRSCDMWVEGRTNEGLVMSITTSTSPRYS